MAINVAELVSEFGTYIQTNQKDILKRLTQPTESQKHMTTKASTSLEYRAAKAVIDDIVQGFQSGWTPKSTPVFTPISIPQRRHKFDIEFYPDDIFDSWLGFLTDESRARRDWPISRYIINELLLPKIEENRELKLIAKGVYEAPVDGVAQDTGKSMDGFVTILKNLKASGTSNVNFFTAMDPTEDNIVDFMEDFVDWIQPLYQSISMDIYVSLTWFKRYKRKYRDLYGTDQDFRGSSSLVLESNNRLVALPSMAGEDVIFCTPKANFIRLINRNEGASNINIENVDRKIKVYSDWHESVGFAMQEAIFAYVPDEDSGSGSGSGASV